MINLLSKVWNFLTGNITRLLAIATNLAAMTTTKKDDKAVALVQSVYDRLTSKK